MGDMQARPQRHFLLMQRAQANRARLIAILLRHLEGVQSTNIEPRPLRPRLPLRPSRGGGNGRHHGLRRAAVDRVRIHDARLARGREDAHGDGLGGRRHGRARHRAQRRGRAEGARRRGGFDVAQARAAAGGDEGLAPPPSAEAGEEACEEDDDGEGKADGAGASKEVVENAGCGCGCGLGRGGLGMGRGRGQGQEEEEEKEREDWEGNSTGREDHDGAGGEGTGGMEGAHAAVGDAGGVARMARGWLLKAGGATVRWQRGRGIDDVDSMNCCSTTAGWCCV